jgi:hypothetical protein
MEPEALAGVDNVTYKFSLVTINEMPDQSHIEIKFGTDLVLKNYPAGKLVMTCE